LATFLAKLGHARSFVILASRTEEVRARQYSYRDSLYCLGGLDWLAATQLVMHSLKHTPVITQSLENNQFGDYLDDLMELSQYHPGALVSVSSALSRESIDTLIIKYISSHFPFEWKPTLDQSVTVHDQLECIRNKFKDKLSNLALLNGHYNRSLFAALFQGPRASGIEIRDYVDMLEEHLSALGLLEVNGTDTQRM